MAAISRTAQRRARRFAGVTARLRAVILPLMLLAALLQADAVVKSAVMNLVGMTPDTAAAMPMKMGAMAMGSAHVCAPAKPPGRPDVSRGKPAAACGYCAAAAHAPLLAFAEPVRPSSAIAFAEFRDIEAHGPRGPPVPQPRARGPPLSA